VHVLIGLVMIGAGSGKAFGFAPPEIVKSMGEIGLGDRMTLIGAGEMIAALLLIVPRTKSLGTLLTSGFWGGVICIHMAHGQDVIMPSVIPPSPGSAPGCATGGPSPVSMAGTAGPPSTRRPSPDRPAAGGVAAVAVR